MRVLRIGFLLAITGFAATVATAGIRYEFQQVKRTSDGQPPTVLIGEAIIDGENSRVEYLDGSTVGAGQYILTTNGGQQTSLVDPGSQTYLSQDSRSAHQTIEQLRVRVKNVKWDQKLLGSGPEIAGYATEHYRVELNYDVIMSIGPLDMTQKIHTTIDKYTTLAFGDVGTSFFRQGLPKTGNQSIDDLIAAEAKDTPGLPLKQTIRVTSTVDEDHLRSSQIQMSKQRVHTTEMTVTAIERIGVKPGVFQIPAAYSRIEQGDAESAIGRLNSTVEVVQPN